MQNLKRVVLFSGVVLLLASAAGCAGKQEVSEGGEGKKLFSDQACNSCHTVDGTTGVGPTLKGLYNKDVTLQDGKTVKADESYIKESITNPDAKIVKGYTAGVMEAAVPQSLRNDQAKVDALVEYIKTLK